MKDTISIVSESRELDQLAAAINKEHQAASGAFRKSLEHAKQVGSLLLEAKKKVGHGKWTAWREKHCPGIGEREAQRYQQIAEAAGSNPSFVSDLTITEALASLATPKRPESTPVAATRPPAMSEPVDDEEVAEEAEDGPDVIPTTPPAARERVKDARGRVVPRDLEAAFIEGKSLVADSKRWSAEWLETIKAAAEKPWGRALSGTLPSIEQELKNVREATRCGVAWACCPHLAIDGSHVHGGTNCKVCFGRGWLTRGVWGQLNEDLKKACDQWAEGDAENEAA